MDIKKVTGIGLAISIVIAVFNVYFVDGTAPVLSEQLYTVAGLLWLVFGSIASYILLKNK